MLITTTAELKSHLSGVQLNMNFVTVEAFIEQAELKYIIPAIGLDLYNELVSLPFSQAPPSGAGGASGGNPLRRHLERSLAFFAIYEAMPSLETALGDFGIVSHETDNRKSAPKWNIQRRETDHQNKGYEWLEYALQYLETNAAQFPTWTASPSYLATQSLFLNSATQFSRHFPALQNRRSIYVRLRSFVEQCEYKHLTGELSQPFFDNLKIAITTPTYVFTAPEQNLLRLIRNFLAEITIYEAHTTLYTELTTAGYRSLYQNTATDYKADSPAADTALTAARQRAFANAQSHRTELRRYLDATASATVFPDYYTSPNYPQPNTTNTTLSLPQNNNKKSFML